MKVCHISYPRIPSTPEILNTYSWCKKKDDLQRGRNSIYFCSNTNRLLVDHKTRTDGNCVEDLNAYVFDIQLNSSRMELSENLPLKLPDP